MHTKKGKSFLGNKIGSPFIHAKSKNIGEAIRNRRPEDMSGGIVSTEILTLSDVVAQAKQTTIKRKTRVLLAKNVDFLKTDILDISILFCKAN